MDSHSDSEKAWNTTRDKRPRTLSVLARFGGTLLEAQLLELQGDRQFRVGPGPEVELCHFSEAPGCVELVDVREGRCLVRIPARWRVSRFVGDRMQEAEELLASGAAAVAPGGLIEYQIPSEGLLLVELGAVELELRAVSPASSLPRPRPALFTSGWVTMALLCMALCFGFAAFLQIGGRSAEPLFVDAAIEPSRWVEIKRAPAIESEREHVHRRVSSRELKRPARQTESRELEAESEALPASPEERRRAVQERARSSGVAGMLSLFGGFGLAEAVAHIKFDPSAENTRSYGELLPHELDSESGTWGHGVRELDKGEGTIKTKDYALSSARERGAEYEAKALSRPHRAESPAISGGAESVLAEGLNYDAIRGQLGLRRRLLRRCFAESDIGAPSPLLLNLTIAASGGVAEASVSNVEEAGPHTCITSALLRIEFPEPGDGQSHQIEGFALRI